MIVPLSWLKDYVEIDISAEELSEKLTMVGLEVEAIEYRGKGIEDVIVAQIIDITPHPDADRLSLCSVTDGNTDYKIVCGANNMQVGDKVALATIGTTLPAGPKFPEGLKIKKTKIRGEISEGMLCAENEIGLSDESSGIMILPTEAELGAKLIDALNIEDVVFEIGITPNRPDCLSIIGIAREVAAILGKELKYPNIELSEDGSDISSFTSVKVNNSSGCPRYSCRVVEGIKIGPSPQWLKNRIESSGIRSINNVVDITNFVLLEYGQPLHAFDYDLLDESRIEVRFAKKSEEIQTLDGEKRKLTSEDLLICDGKKPIALAGVMGGADTEVNEDTKNILIESAYFNPVTVRKTSKRTGLRSESSFRFERGVDPNGIINALDRAASLVVEIAHGKLANGLIDEYPNLIKSEEITISVDRVNTLLGAEMSVNEIGDLLRSIEFDVLSSEKDTLTVKAATYRVDIEREIDIVEEIGRLYGYNNIPSVSPNVQMITDTVNVERGVASKLKEFFISQGFLETVNYSFENPSLLGLFNKNSGLGLINPLTTESSVMRTTLLVGLLNNLKLNLSRQSQDIRLFEIGKVFFPMSSSDLPNEEKRFCAVATGSRYPEMWEKRDTDFFDLKGVFNGGLEALSLSSNLKFDEVDSEIEFLHHGKSSSIFLNSKKIGFIGELHPDILEELEINRKVYLLEVSMDEIIKTYFDVSISFTSLPKFPSIKRDIALLVDRHISSGSILDQMKNVSNLIEDAWIFDVFEGDNVEQGKKSIGISMLLRSVDKTLTDEEANKVQEKALNKLSSSLGAELRST